MGEGLKRLFVSLNHQRTFIRGVQNEKISQEEIAPENERNDENKENLTIPSPDGEIRGDGKKKTETLSQETKRLYRNLLNRMSKRRLKRVKKRKGEKYCPHRQLFQFSGDQDRVKQLAVGTVHLSNT